MQIIVGPFITAVSAILTLSCTNTFSLNSLNSLPKVGIVSNIKLLIKNIALPLIIGIIVGLIMMPFNDYKDLIQPPLSPPAILFPIVWTILYTLMGIASYLVLASGKNQDDITQALLVYLLQLTFNFFWSIFFFNLEWYLFAFFWLILLWFLIQKTIQQFYPLSKTAAYLMIPYFVWVTFAGYLNLGIYLLN